MRSAEDHRHFFGTSRRLKEDYRHFFGTSPFIGTSHRHFFGPASALTSALCFYTSMSLATACPSKMGQKNNCLTACAPMHHPQQGKKRARASVGNVVAAE